MTTIKISILNRYAAALSTLPANFTNEATDETAIQKAQLIKDRLSKLTAHEENDLSTLRKYDEDCHLLDIDKILYELQNMNTKVSYFNACLHANRIAKHIQSSII